MKPAALLNLKYIFKIDIFLGIGLSTFQINYLIPEPFLQYNYKVVQK